MTSRFFSKRPGSIDIAWCPGCGNFGIRTILAEALESEGFSPGEIVLASGIGQAAKMPHYLNLNGFHTLHGRSIPVATAIKIVNPELTVIAEGGDGDIFAEGGNHFLHAIRRNPDLTLIVHNNQVYGLTKGQASPTSAAGMKTPAQPDGVIEAPLNAAALAISQDGAFVARTFSGFRELTLELLKKALRFRGFSMVEILHPCPSFNKTNSYDWYRNNCRILQSHDPRDRDLAMQAALRESPLELGLLYLNEREAFEKRLPVYAGNGLPLVKRKDRASLIREVTARLTV